MALPTPREDTRIRPRELSREEGRRVFDRAARTNLGMSGEEFLRKWDAGEFGADPEDPRVVTVAMLIHLER